MELDGLDKGITLQAVGEFKYVKENCRAWMITVILSPPYVSDITRVFLANDFSTSSREGSLRSASGKVTFNPSRRRHSPARTHIPPDIVYEYTAHLRAQVEAAPQAPGVYLFYAEGDSILLYIGKNIDILSRQFSHLRAPEEARMLRQTQQI